MILLYSSILLNCATNSKVFPPVSFLEMKIMFYFKYVQVVCALLVLTPSFETNCIKIQAMNLVLNLF